LGKILLLQQYIEISEIFTSLNDRTRKDAYPIIGQVNWFLKEIAKFVMTQCIHTKLTVAYRSLEFKAQNTYIFYILIMFILHIKCIEIIRVLFQILNFSIICM
jgi:hypothetical protein